jgi:hypothetical protein
MRTDVRCGLSDDQRRVAFFAAAAAVVSVVVVIGALGGGQTARRMPARTTGLATSGAAPRIADQGSLRFTSPTAPDAVRRSMASTTTTTPAPAVTAVTSLTRAPTRAATPAPAPAARAVILAHARTFLAAYLAYEVGQLDPRMRAALTRTATPAFARQLITRPINLPPRDRPAVSTIQSVELNAASGSPLVTADATTEHGGWLSGLTLYLEPAGGRWLVSSLT